MLNKIIKIITVVFTYTICKKCFYFTLALFDIYLLNI